MTWLHFICRVYVCLFLQHRLQFSGELIADGGEKGQYDVNTGQNNVSLKFIIGYNHLEVLMLL